MMSKNAVELPSPHDRKRLLDQTRNLKMARSPHRYVRGSIAKFYQRVDDLKGGAIPECSAILIHGDCHSGNLGPIANRDGAIAASPSRRDESSHPGDRHVARPHFEISGAAV
jgi:uncharacterized protein (DUF2252 family)